jgi:hypothetical protein
MKLCATQRRKAARNASNNEYAQAVVRQGFEPRARAYFTDGFAG